MTAWRRRRELNMTVQNEIESSRLAGAWSPQYRFDEGVLTDTDVSVTERSVVLGEQSIALRVSVPDAWRIV